MPATTKELFVYGPMHWVFLLVTVIGVAAIVVIGKRGHDKERLTRILAWTLLITAVAVQVYWFLPQNYSLRQSWPLHVSDVLRFIAVYALWTKKPWAVAVTYYWGLTLNPQAMLTPDISIKTIPIVELLSYWVLHILVLWAAVYLVWGLQIRPTWRHYRVAMIFTVVWSMAVLVINEIIGTNYAYLNGKPPGGSALDWFGPWPWYLVVVFGLLLVGWALLTWPWTRKTAPSPAETASLPPAGDADQRRRESDPA